MNAETIAALVAAVIAIGAGLRKAKEFARDDSAVSSVVALLRQENERLSGVITALKSERDSLYGENVSLRGQLEQRDRDHHECQMALNRERFNKEMCYERPENQPARND